MKYIATTFAHGNGPFSRALDWAVEVNNVREEKGMERLPVVMPLVYPGREERILKEEIDARNPHFLARNPHEILFDRIHGSLLGKLMFRGKDYTENLISIADNFWQVEYAIREHLDGKRKVEDFHGETVELDLRDAELQLGLNNRMQTGLQNQFYSAIGAGPFDEILERALADNEAIADRSVIRRVLPVARRMIQNQRLIFSNQPGVFSYDSGRKSRETEIQTPPFIHLPQPDLTDLPGKGIYLLMTGIDGIREAGIYDAVTSFGMHLFAPEFSLSSLPEGVRKKATALAPSRINNPNVVAQYARAGWSTVWLSHLSEKGFLTPKHDKKDDLEMLFNQRGIASLGLGAIVDDNPRKSLEEAITLAGKVSSFNESLRKEFGTLDGIRYAAEIVSREMGYV